QEIVIDEFRRTGRVCQDPAHSARDEEHVLGLVCPEPGVDGCLVAQVQVLAPGCQDLTAAFRSQTAQNGGPHKSSVAAHEDPARTFHVGKSIARESASPIARNVVDHVPLTTTIAYRIGDHVRTDSSAPDYLRADGVRPDSRVVRADQHEYETVSAHPRTELEQAAQLCS